MEFELRLFLSGGVIAVLGTAPDVVPHWRAVLWVCVSVFHCRLQSVYAGIRRVMRLGRCGREAELLILPHYDGMITLLR